ncbi:hypothetical protein BAE44_0016058 [Dichanthelium oligosanthes]|uniref:Uncharacterized protein n=1 Tax=Dichanthelium oligosanthes TaxID=888268 RepID=A0A1E5VCP4_9POAL|nr:hypothetical protein BAE44_0016058 [Dichanthelium oligosanthes]
MLLRRAVEDLRAEIRSSSTAVPVPAAATARGVGRVAATAPPQQQQHYNAFPAKADRGRGAAREPAPEKAGKAAAPDDVGEELKKALEARLR